jgi:uncharacterized protein
MEPRYQRGEPRMTGRIGLLCATAALLPWTAAAQTAPDEILLKDYRPQSIYKIPVNKPARARFPVIDMHSHAYARTPEEVDAWVKTMDAVGIEKTVVLTGATGERFDRAREMYGKYPDRFELWCGIAFSGFDQPGFADAAVRELERCHRLGARGVGEISDKGRGLTRAKDGAPRLHPDDPRLDPVFKRCGELGMPVNIHVADPIWMYQPMDQTNDGMMNAFRWRLDNQPGIVGHDGMMRILERTVERHPGTTFVACHFANLSYDLERLGGMLDRNPNLYVDNSARYAETAAIPRFTAAFYAKHQDRILYGTDMGLSPTMYPITFRILETLDEHFYERGQFGYHWSLNGLGLPDDVLRKVYRENALRIMRKR